MANSEHNTQIVSAESARASWDAAMAVFLEAERESNALSEELDHAHRAFLERCEKVPHVTLASDPYTGRYLPVSTADARAVAEARRLVRDVAEGRCRLGPILELQKHYELFRQLAAAADERQALIGAIDAETGYSKAEQEHDSAVDKMCEARDALIAMPAPDGEALLWKLDWLFFTDHVWNEDFVAPAIADARRMLKAA